MSTEEEKRVYPVHSLALSMVLEDETRFTFHLPETDTVMFVVKGATLECTSLRFPKEMRPAKLTKKLTATPTIMCTVEEINLGFQLSESGMFVETRREGIEAQLMRIGTATVLIWMDEL